MRESRAVVLVCTPEYFDSRWTELESKLAFGKSDRRHPQALRAARLAAGTHPSRLQDAGNTRAEPAAPPHRDSRSRRWRPRRCAGRSSTILRRSGSAGSSCTAIGTSTSAAWARRTASPLSSPSASFTYRFGLSVQLPTGEMSDRGPLRVAGRAPSREEARATGLHASEAQSVLRFVRRTEGRHHPRGPGQREDHLPQVSGARPGARRVTPLLGLPPLLPLVLPLSALAQNTEIPVANFAADFYAERREDAAVGTLVRRALNEGKALVLNDGLDEVREERKRLDVGEARRRVRGAVPRRRQQAGSMTAGSSGYHVVRLGHRRRGGMHAGGFRRAGDRGVCREVDGSPRARRTGGHGVSRRRRRARSTTRSCGRYARTILSEARREPLPAHDPGPDAAPGREPARFGGWSCTTPMCGRWCARGTWRAASISPMATR